MASDPGLAGDLHTKDGWYFGRLKDGSVQITVTEPAAEYPATLETIVLDANSWASAVSFVSARGENAETFGEALRFHASVEEETE